ncbi:MAG: hypothetical protein ABIN74_06365 [Ferruginibacter sp.]
MKKIKLFLLAGITLLFAACETIKNLPTNTSGGIFSLNGSWRLTSTTDNNAQSGTVVTVSPAIASAFVKTLVNNSYCYRVSDEAWKSLSSRPNGGFTIQSLATACNGTAIYKTGEITVLSNDLVRVNTKTATDVALVQEWTRVAR